MGTKHTPGPWVVNITSSRMEKGSYEIESESYLSEKEYNARLIAAAPGMLNALKQIASRLHYIDELTHQEGFIFAIAKQAIAKAEGRN